MSLENMAAVVTGASRGIGRSIASRLVVAGSSMIDGWLVPWKESQRIGEDDD